MNIWNYSENEQLLIKQLGLDHLSNCPNFPPYLLFREMALVCFRNKYEGVIANAVRNGLKYLEDPNSHKRGTEEYENSIFIKLHQNA